MMSRCQLFTDKNLCGLIPLFFRISGVISIGVVALKKYFCALVCAVLVDVRIGKVYDNFLVLSVYSPQNCVSWFQAWQYRLLGRFCPLRLVSSSQTLIILFGATSTCLVWAEFSHTGAAYSTVETIQELKSKVYEIVLPILSLSSPFWICQFSDAHIFPLTF